MSRGTRRERHGGAVAARRAVRVLGRYTACCLVLAFFSLPLLWLASAPFDRTPGTAVSLPEFTLANFRALWDNPYAVDSLRNSVVLAAGAGALTVVSAALAAYALSRVRAATRCCTRCCCCRRSSPGRPRWCRCSTSPTSCT